MKYSINKFEVNEQEVLIDDSRLTELEYETSYSVEVNDADCVFYRQPLMIMTNKDIISTNGEIIDSDNYSLSKPIYNIDITKRIYVSGTSYRYLYCYSDDGYIGRVDASTGVVLSANESYANTKYVRVLCYIGEENNVWVGYVPTSENYNPIKGYILGLESETKAKLNKLESIVGETRLNPGINLFALNTGKQYVFTNNSEFNFSVGYYKSIDDANADMNYVKICDLNKGNSFLFVATEDAPITYISKGEGYSCIVETLDGLRSIREDVGTLIDDKSDKLSAYEITNEYITENGNLGSSDNYTAFKYRIGGYREKNSVIRATIGSLYTEDAAIAFYNSTTLNDTTCIKTIPRISGVVVYEQEIPTEAIVVVISTKNSIFAEDTADIYHPKCISSLRHIIYSANLKPLSRSNSYINKDSGGLGNSKNYTAFYYEITSKLWGSMLTVIAGANSTDDAAVGFYSENSPAPENCIKTIPSVIGTHTYKEEIPTGTQCVVVSTRTSLYSDESVQIDSSEPLIDTGFIINDHSINLRVGSFNVGNYNGTGMENGSDELKKAYRELLAHNTKTLIAFQQDYNKFGDANPREEVWGMFRSFEIRDASVFCDGFASDIRLNNTRDILYTGDTFSHNAFYVAELYIEDKTILVVSFHFDWQDKNRRALQYQQIIEYAESYDYAIIMGDTNCENYEDGVRLDTTILIEEWDRFKENGYTMANNGYFGLYDTYTSGGVGEPIDNIFVKGNIVITNFEVIRKDWMSDHFLLFADLVIY